MSDSDSQSNQSFNMGQVPQQHQSHVKQILQKGKKILPSYDQSTLYSLYKKYYSADNIFFNELNIIAKRMNGAYDEDNQKKNNHEWVTVGRKVRTKVNKSKYNFLEDKQLIRRAEQYLKNKSILPQRRQHQNNDNRQSKQYQNNRNYNQNRDNSPNKNNKYQYQQRKPKLKFVQKIQDKPVNTTTTTTNNVNNNTINKQVQNKQQNNNKNLKYIEKDGVIKKQEQKTNVVPVEVKKIETTNVAVKRQEPVVVAAKKNEQQVKEAPKQQQPKIQKVSPAVVTKQQPLKSQPIKPQPVKPQAPVVQKLQLSKPFSQPQQSTSPTKTSSSAKIIIDQTYDAKIASKNFQQAARQNSFILSFIKPQPYPQRVSYVRGPNGQIKDVKIRVAGTAN